MKIKIIFILVFFNKKYSIYIKKKPFIYDIRQKNQYSALKDLKETNEKKKQNYKNPMEKNLNKIAERWKSVFLIIIYTLCFIYLLLLILNKIIFIIMIQNAYNNSTTETKEQIRIGIFTNPLDMERMMGKAIYNLD
jgi:uncharacterized membrane protein